MWLLQLEEWPHLKMAEEQKLTDTTRSIQACLLSKLQLHGVCCDHSVNS
jgi:hypothetical protein